MKNGILFKIIIEVLYYVWVLCYGLTVLCFFIALFSKFLNPEVSNLNWNQFAIVGAILFGLLLITIMVIRRRAKKTKV